MTPVHGIVDAIRRAGFQVEDRFGEFRCQCPAHGTKDSDCNLQVREDDRGAALLKCYSSDCSTESILQAVGLTKQHLFPDKWATNGHAHTNGNGKARGDEPKVFATDQETIACLERKLGPVVASWWYQNDKGRVIGGVLRFDKAGDPDGKEIRPIRLVNGGWSIGAMAVPRPLYRRPVLDDKDAHTVFVVEGEKCVDALMSLKLWATTSPGGSKAAHQADWAPLAGKVVIILPDNDEAGEGYCRDVVACLAKLDPQPTVKVVRLTNLPSAGDVVDFIAASKPGFTDQQIAEHLQMLADEAEAIQLPDKFTESSDSRQEPPKDNYTRQQDDGPKFTLPRITSAELDGNSYDVEYLIENALVANQETIIAGAFKTLKTSIAIDMAISLDRGGFFLGKFRVLRQCRVGVLTGEGGLATIQDTARRICRAAGHSLSDCGIIWSNQLPKFYDAGHLEALSEWITRDSIEVVFIEPAYLAMPSQDAGNLMAQGVVLRAVAETCRDAGAMPVIGHHNNRRNIASYDPPELGDVAWSGFAEWAGQWFLLGRRAKYDPNTGHHELWLNLGGRAGHSGLWAVDIEEGSRDSIEGRKWEVDVLRADEARQEASERREAERRQRKEEKDTAEREEAKRNIARVLASHPDGETETALRTLTGMGPGRISPAIAEMLANGDLEMCEIVKKNKAYQGIRLPKTATV